MIAVPTPATLAEGVQVFVIMSKLGQSPSSSLREMHSGLRGRLARSIMAKMPRSGWLTRPGSGSRVRYDEGGHPRRFRLGRLGWVQPRRDDHRGDGPAGDGRHDAGPGFRPVYAVPVRREGDLDDRVPVVLARDYHVGFEEVGAAVPADKSVADGLVYGAVQSWIGQAIRVQGNVGDFEPQGEPRSGQGLGANGAFVLPALQVADLTFYGVESPVGQTVGLLLGFVGFLLRLVEFPLGLDEAVEPAGQVQQVLGEEEGSERLGPGGLIPQDAGQIFDGVDGGRGGIVP